MDFWAFSAPSEYFPQPAVARLTPTNSVAPAIDIERNRVVMLTPSSGVRIGSAAGASKVSIRMVRVRTDRSGQGASNCRYPSRVSIVNPKRPRQRHYWTVQSKTVEGRSVVATPETRANNGGILETWPIRSTRGAGGTRLHSTFRDFDVRHRRP